MKVHSSLPDMIPPTLHFAKDGIPGVREAHTLVGYQQGGPYDCGDIAIALECSCGRELLGSYGVDGKSCGNSYHIRMAPPELRLDTTHRILFDLVTSVPMTHPMLLPQTN